jgi:hypothetical protein
LDPTPAAVVNPLATFYSDSTMMKLFIVLSAVLGAHAFAPTPAFGRPASILRAEGNLVNQVTGEELEVMMQEWEQPLIVDAYATVSTVLSWG